jgi:protein-tyrosine-phosphatase
VRYLAGAADAAAAAATSWRCGVDGWGSTDGCPTSGGAAGLAACFCVPIEPPSGTKTDHLRLDYADALPAPRNAQRQTGRQAALATRIVDFYRACALALHVGAQSSAKSRAEAAANAADKVAAELRPALTHCDAHRKRAEQALADVMNQCPQVRAEHLPLVADGRPGEQPPPPAHLEYATLSLDCSNALLPPPWTGVTTDKKQRGKSVPVYSVHLVTCTYAGGPLALPVGPGAPLPPVKVPVLLLFSEDGQTFIRAHAVAARGHDSNNNSDPVLRVAGFALRGEDPVGSAAAAASGELTVLELFFRDDSTKFASFEAASAAVRSVAAAVYICGGNTGRSPVAEAVAVDTLIKDGLYNAAPVFSRLKEAKISSEGEFVEADVRNAVARLLPREIRLLEHLDLHRARPSSGPALAFARVILTASETHRDDIRALMAKHYGNERAAAVRPAPAALPPAENIYTIKEWLDLSAAQKTVNDPFIMKHNTNEAVLTTAFEAMVEEMLTYVPPGAKKAAQGVFPVDSVIKTER